MVLPGRIGKERKLWVVCRRFVHDYFVKFLPIIKKKNSGVNQWAYFGKLPFYLIRFFLSFLSFFFLLFFSCQEGLDSELLICNLEQTSRLFNLDFVFFGVRA